MRHRKSGRQLNRNSSHRKAMFRNMVASLLEHGAIKTTVAKAKELRGIAERLITIAKNKGKTDASFKLLLGKLGNNKKAVEKLFLVAPSYKDRTGGYTRVLKTEPRTGDSAPMAFIELVDFPKSDDAKVASAA